MALRSVKLSFAAPESAFPFLSIALGSQASLTLLERAGAGDDGHSAGEGRESHVYYRLDHSSGLIAGLGSKIVNKTGEGFFLDIVLGILGAIVGGVIFTAVCATGVTGFTSTACSWRLSEPSSCWCFI